MNVVRESCFSLCYDCAIVEFGGVSCNVVHRVVRVFLVIRVCKNCVEIHDVYMYPFMDVRLYGSIVTIGYGVTNCGG